MVDTKSPEESRVRQTPGEGPSSTNEEPAEAPKSELPPELKTVHDSPAPRNAPIKQEEDTPKDSRERAKLLDQAIAFLETGSVRDAPLLEKQEFLKSKGLTAAEAEELIRKVNRQKEKREGKRRASYEGQQIQRLPQPPPRAQQQPQQPQQQNTTIVTYPEWLAPPPPAAPRPLVTGATLVSALYFGAATAATVYGANKFVVTPMLDALTEARLDFSTTVKKNLDRLNEQLLELAPASHIANKGLRVREEDEESEASDVSDPTELFHVDAETQTTASLLEHGNDDEMGTGAMTPDSKLEELTSQMKVLVESHSDGTDNELTFLLEDLTSYLEGLTYDSAQSSNMYASPFGGYGKQVEKDKDDPILKVKQEIRSVKGVLLNTKNFPASR